MTNIRPYERAFPFFSAELPEIDGFEDTTALFDRCPNLTNKDIGLRLYIDTVNAEDSSLKHQRTEGTLRRYTVYQITDEGLNCDDWSLSTDAYGDITDYVLRHDFLINTPAY